MSLLLPIKLPPLTIPFNIATWTWLLCTSSNSAYFPIDGRQLKPRLVAHPPGESQHDFTGQPLDASQVVLAALFKGASQVYLQDSVAGGALIICGVAVYAWQSALLGVAGSVVGTGTALALGVPAASVEAGLWSYNGFLFCQGLREYFVVDGSKIWAYGLLGAMLTSLLTGAFRSLLAPVGMPALTVPFVLSSWFIILAGKDVRGIVGTGAGQGINRKRRPIFSFAAWRSSARSSKVLPFKASTHA